MSKTIRPDDPFRRLVRTEQLLWVLLTLIAPPSIAGVAMMMMGTMGEPVLAPELAISIAAAAAVGILVMSTLLGNAMTSPQRMDAVQHLLLPTIDGADADTSVPEPMRQAYRQAAYLHRVSLMQFALAESAVMVGLVMALLSASSIPVMVSAGAGMLHGIIHRPRLRGFLRERGRVVP